MNRYTIQLYDDFVNKFLEPLNNEKIKILEVGSRLENSRILLRDKTNNKNWEFIGLDIENGRNVDVVSDNPYKYPFEDNSFDIIISSNTLEHIKDTKKWIKEISRISKNLVWIVVPNTYREHGKFDYWRIMPRGMRYLLEEVAGLKIIEIGFSKYNIQDTFCIAKKSKK